MISDLICCHLFLFFFFKAIITNKILAVIPHHSGLKKYLLYNDVYKQMVNLENNIKMKLSHNTTHPLLSLEILFCYASILLSSRICNTAKSVVDGEPVSGLSHQISCSRQKAIASKTNNRQICIRSCPSCVWTKPAPAAVV